MLNSVASGSGQKSGQKKGMDYKVPTLDGDYRRGAGSLLRIARMGLNYPLRLALALGAVVVAGLFQLFIQVFNTLLGFHYRIFSLVFIQAQN